MTCYSCIAEYFYPVEGTSFRFCFTLPLYILIDYCHLFILRLLIVFNLNCFFKYKKDEHVQQTSGSAEICNVFLFIKDVILLLIVMTNLMRFCVVSTLMYIIPNMYVNEHVVVDSY